MKKNIALYIAFAAGLSITLLFLFYRDSKQPLSQPTTGLALSTETEQLDSRFLGTPLTPEQAANHIGETALVRGKVVQVSTPENYNFVYLNFTREHPHNDFYVRIPFLDLHADRYNFQHYQGKVVLVYGKIEQGGGKSHPANLPKGQIILTSLADIKIDEMSQETPERSLESFSQQSAAEASPEERIRGRAVKALPFGDEFDSGELDQRWNKVGSHLETSLNQRPGSLLLREGWIEQQPLNNPVFSLETKIEYFPSGADQSVTLGISPIGGSGFIHLKTFTGNGHLIDCHTWYQGTAACDTPGLTGLAGGIIYLRAIRENNKITTYFSQDGFNYYLVRVCDISWWGNNPYKLEVRSFNHVDNTKAGKIYVDYFRIKPGVIDHPRSILATR